jgi:hypothetical protein
MFWLEGTWQVKKGVLIDTNTKHSDTNATALPIISRVRIIRADDEELVLEGDTASSEVILRKQKQ